MEKYTQEVGTHIHSRTGVCSLLQALGDKITESPACVGVTFYAEKKDKKRSRGGLWYPRCHEGNREGTASLLIFWSPPTSAQLGIESVNAAEGKNVVLRMRNKPDNIAGFMWYKGEKPDYRHFIASISWHIRRYRSGPGFDGRQVANFDGSLTINKVKLSDSGPYNVVVYLHDSKKEIGFGRLNVYQPVRMPTLLASNTDVTEQKDSVVMTCYTDAPSTRWLFEAEDLRLKNRMKLSEDRRTLTIDPVRREDSGNYQCKVSNPISSVESAPVELDVKY